MGVGAFGMVLGSVLIGNTSASTDPSACADVDRASRRSGRDGTSVLVTI